MWRTTMFPSVISPWAVDHPGVDHRRAARRPAMAWRAAAVGEGLGALVVVDPGAVARLGRFVEHRRPSGRPEGDEAGDVEHPLDRSRRLGRGEHVLQAADVDAVELLARGARILTRAAAWTTASQPAGGPRRGSSGR